MSHVLATLTARFDNPVSRSDKLSVSRAVLRFRQTRTLADFLETKYVCIAAWDNFSGWCLLEDAELLGRLLTAVSTGPARRRLKYFSCLLRSYLQFPRYSDEGTPGMLIGWVKLRDWLRTHEKDLSTATGSQPAWLRALHEHPNLLDENPCEPYKKELLSGGSKRLNEVFSKLSVPVDSWLRQEALFSQIQAGTDLGNTEFQSRLPQLVQIATGETEFKLSRKLSIRCVALLISRYAACDGTFRHGVAFSLQTTRELPTIDPLVPKIAKFNEYLSLYPDAFMGFEMWNFTDGVRSENYPVGPIPDSQVSAGVFIFIGRLRPKNAIDTSLILDDFDRLLPPL